MYVLSILKVEALISDVLMLVSTSNWDLSQILFGHKSPKAVIMGLGKNPELFERQVTNSLFQYGILGNIYYYIHNRYTTAQLNVFN